MSEAMERYGFTSHLSDVQMAGKIASPTLGIA